MGKNKNYFINLIKVKILKKNKTKLNSFNCNNN